MADLAEEANHHPDILVHGWNNVRLTLTTHSEGGLTDNDFQMARTALETLSSRQLEVLHLLAQGLPNELIAERLFISRNTVKFHVAAIYQRLGVTNRVQAAQALGTSRAAS